MAAVQERLDFGLLHKALDMEAERNDSVRLRIRRKGFKKEQYFLPSFLFGEIPFVDFTGKTQAEQDAYFSKEASVPIRFARGESMKVIFGRAYNGQDMLYVKVCHLFMDTYAIGLFFKDLFDIYHALEKGEEMPPPLTSFEECLKKDLEYLGDSERVSADEQFFREYLNSHEEPYFAPVSGDDCKVWKKRQARGLHTMRMYLLNNRTAQLSYDLSDELVGMIQKLCEIYKSSPGNVMIAAAAVALSKINHNEKSVRLLDLCNGRATVLARGCGGSKVQSMAAHFSISQEEAFSGLVERYAAEQTLMYRHLGYPDPKYEYMGHEVYHSSRMGNYYPLLFSYIPLSPPGKDTELMMFSSGRFALPVYMGVLHDTESGKMKIGYDYQKVIMNAGHVQKYQKMFEEILRELSEDPQAKIGGLLTSKQ